jgi:hypothetical protein
MSIAGLITSFTSTIVLESVADSTRIYLKTDGTDNHLEVPSPGCVVFGFQDGHDKPKEGTTDEIIRGN